MFWRRKKYIFVLEHRKKEAGPKRRFFRVRNVVIAAAMLLVVISSIQYEKNRLKRRQAALDILHLREMADRFISEHGGCPGSIEEIEAAAGARKGSRGSNVRDPWGRRYEFICPGKKGQGPLEIISAGPDRKYYTIDDVKMD